MQILSPEKIQGQRAKTEGEAIERIRRLREEEAAANLALSQIRAKLAVDTEKIEREFAVFEEETSKQIRSLSQEVRTLETARREALRPIEELRTTAEGRLREAKALEDDLEQELIALKEREQDLLERTLSLREQEDEVASMLADLGHRKQRIEGEEDGLKRSLSELATRWTEYHKTIHVTNESLAQRERMIESGRQANLAFKTSLDTLKAELLRDRLAIEDGYRSLQKAREEILGRKE